MSFNLEAVVGHEKDVQDIAVRAFATRLLFLGLMHSRFCFGIYPVWVFK